MNNLANSFTLIRLHLSLGSRVYPNGQGSWARPGRGKRCARALPSRLVLRARNLGFAIAICATRSRLGLCNYIIRKKCSIIYNLPIIYNQGPIIYNQISIIYNPVDEGRIIYNLILTILQGMNRLYITSILTILRDRLNIIWNYPFGGNLLKPGSLYF